MSFNKSSLTQGTEYDYVTRTSQNQGILAKTGYVNKSHINKKGTWSLGLLQMDFFYRNKPWYAGQFVRKIVPKIQLTNESIIYFTTLFNKIKPTLLSGLVRDVDQAFNRSKINLPTQNQEISFSYINKFIAALEAERIQKLEAYLTVTGLKNWELTKYDEELIDIFNNLTTDSSRNKYSFISTELSSIFNWCDEIKELNPLKLDELIDNSEKEHPFYGQATVNNGIINYQKLTRNVLNNKDSKPTILIHSNNQNVVYLETPFYLKDGHGATSVLQSEQLNRYNALFIMTSIKKIIEKRFNYNAKATKIGLKRTSIKLPYKGGKVDNDFMSDFIKVIEKLVIRDLAEWTDRKFKATK